MRNMAYKTHMKNAIKDVRVAVSGKEVEQAGDKLKKAVSIIQKTASKGVIHRNKASRQISRLSRLVNTATSS
jgi:small subunit ribosomal protein S20